MLTVASPFISAKESRGIPEIEERLHRLTMRPTHGLIGNETQKRCFRCDQGAPSGVGRGNPDWRMRGRRRHRPIPEIGSQQSLHSGRLVELFLDGRTSGFRLRDHPHDRPCGEGRAFIELFEIMDGIRRS